jgi:hypothetical protein
LRAAEEASDVLQVVEVLALNAIQGHFVVGRSVRRTAKEHQFEGFQFHGHSPGSYLQLLGQGY